ncbi:MAG: hypothetical protein MAG451_00699 [Anaerolineales bacterium]|nr:hypothetical protein [Anaerolineales bacterium]
MKSTTRATARRLLILAALMGAVCFLIGCVPAQPAWKQGPAIKMPHTAATVGALELVVYEEDGTLVLSAVCVSEGAYRNVTIEAQVADDNVAANAIEGVSEQESVVCEPGQTVLRSFVGEISDVAVGEEVEVALSIQPMPDYEGVVKQIHLYMMGTDGKLRSGAGSVWK